LLKIARLGEAGKDGEAIASEPDIMHTKGI
jgi:hypothetical protein